MTRLTYVKALSQALEPLGFVYQVAKTRDKEWIRIRDGFEDCVLLHVSSIAGTTCELSTRDMTTVAILEKAAPQDDPGWGYAEFVRLPALVDGNGGWWRNDPNGPAEMVALIESHGLGYFESLRTLEAQAKQFGLGSPRPWGHVPSLLRLAVTLWRMGRGDEACALLTNPPNGPISKPLPKWLARAEALRAWLGCKG
jgi:hypothetical protein